VEKVFGRKAAPDHGLVEVEPAAVLWSACENPRRSLPPGCRTHSRRWRLRDRTAIRTAQAVIGSRASRGSPLSRFGAPAHWFAAQVSARSLRLWRDEVCPADARHLRQDQCQNWWAAGQRPQPQASSLARVWRGAAGVGRKEGGKPSRRALTGPVDRGLICHPLAMVDRPILRWMGRKLRTNA